MLGTAAALMVAAGTASAGMSLASGQAQSKAIKNKASFDAQIYEQQAEMVKQKKSVADQQFLRQSTHSRGGIVSATAGKGLLLKGSPLAVLADNESQMQFDKAIQDYNFAIDENLARSGATQTRAQGGYQSRLAQSQGFSNAFSTALNTGFQAYRIGKL